MLQKYNTKNPYIYVIFCLFLILNSCSMFSKDQKSKEKDNEDEIVVKKPDYEPNVLKRIDSRYRKDDQPTLFGSGKNKNETLFASNNILWRASLKTLDNIPLTEANYSGGIIITDWYSSDFGPESIKMQIFFLSPDLKVSSIQVKSYKKICKENGCQTIALGEDFNSKIKAKIIDNAKQISIDNSKSKK